MSIFASKNFLIAAGMVLMLFIAVAIGTGFKQYDTSSLVDSAATAAISVKDKTALGVYRFLAAQPDKQINSDADFIEHPRQSRDSGLARVVRVIDGDTIEIEGGEKVRYIGIDTPETVDPRKSVQCFGLEASNKNKELIGGKMVRLEKDITDRDKYNRILRYVWVGGVFVNLELIKQGFAYSYSYPPDVKYQDQFIKAQQEAREAERGLWSVCPSTPEQNTSIPAVSPAPNSDSCLIKGNISSSGEKIYHLPGCGSYAKTKIDEARGEKWFCAESEALAAGWRKALNCP